MNPEDLSLADAASAIRAGKLSPVEYVQALFGVMDRIESRVQAWVTVDRERVLGEARRCEAERTLDADGFSDNDVAACREP